jgi:phosphatidate phosphatase APP1
MSAASASAGDRGRPQIATPRHDSARRPQGRRALLHLSSEKNAPARKSEIITDWREELRALAASVSSRVRRGTSALENLVDRDPDPYHIIGYRGYGRPGRVLVLGRVLQDERLVPAAAAHSKFRNLVAMLKRLESDPLPFARVRARLPGGNQELVADDEGYIRAWLNLDPQGTKRWGTVPLELIDPVHHAAAVQAPFLTPPSSATYGVISDMDDTVLQSEITNFIRAARTVLLENARTRLPFAGVAAFYRALEEGPAGGSGNPIFYVSSSPWNLYDVIADFLEAQSIPVGPILLRDWDLGPSLLRTATHKTGLIRDILATFPSMSFILIGDSTQEDPEIYTEIVSTHPQRILAVYIRNVRPHPERSEAVQELARRVAEAGSTLVLADDTLTVASHAATHGWIRQDALPGIGEEKRADEGAGGKAAAPGVEPAEPVPPVVVDKDVNAAQLE